MKMLNKKIQIFKYFVNYNILTKFKKRMKGGKDIDDREYKS
jgi:hypothetical protein